jgi:hypothetical protein
MFGSSRRRKAGWIALLVLGAVAIASGATYAVASATGSGGASAAPARADSITVRGRWTIRVLDRSRKVATVRRFENALILPQIPARILGRKASPGLWDIYAQDNSGNNNSPCGGRTCLIRETRDASSPLTVSAPARPDPGPLTLNGQFTATQNGVINRVGTGLMECPYGADVPCSFDDAIPGTASVSFTGKDISQLSITAGQQVLVRVDISFTSAP